MSRKKKVKSQRVNKVLPKSPKKTRTVAKKAKAAKKKIAKPKLPPRRKYTTWANSLRSNVKPRPQKPKQARKAPKSAGLRKGKTVKRKLKSRKAKSSKPKQKKPKRKKPKRKAKKKTKPKARPKLESSFISDLSAKEFGNARKRDWNFEIEDTSQRNVQLQAGGALNFVYQANGGTQADGIEPEQHLPNPFRAAIKLPANSGQSSRTNTFGAGPAQLLSKGGRE